MYWFKASAIRLKCRKSCQGHCEVHFSLESDRLPRFALGRLNAQLSRCSINGHIHETIESDGYSIRPDTVQFKRSGKIAKAAVVGLLVTVDDAEDVLAAWREEEVVSTYSILDDTQHHVAAIRIEWVAFGKVESTRIVKCASGGNDLVDVAGIECE